MFTTLQSLVVGLFLKIDEMPFEMKISQIEKVGLELPHGLAGRNRKSNNIVITAWRNSLSKLGLASQFSRKVVPSAPYAINDYTPA